MNLEGVEVLSRGAILTALEERRAPSRELLVDLARHPDERDAPDPMPRHLARHEQTHTAAEPRAVEATSLRRRPRPDAPPLPIGEPVGRPNHERLHVRRDLGKVAKDEAPRRREGAKMVLDGRSWFISR